MRGLEKLSSTKTSEEAAGYMELSGAVKDASCSIVNVEGGVSKNLGCCNLYDPVKGAKKFDCGNCDKLMEKSNA